MSWLEIGVYMVLGFVLLGKGAYWLVGGATVLARRLGVGAMVVGLTVVAWGTSLPEVVVSTMAAVDGNGAISLGNVLGSNIANIALVLGACALVLPSILEGRLGNRESFWLLISLAVFWLLCSDGALSRMEGVALLAFFAAHTWDVFRQAKIQRLEGMSDSAAESEADDGKHKFPIFEALVGMLAIAGGAWLVVEGAKAGAELLHVDKRIVGLTVVAIGTSLPELAAGLQGAFRGEKDISLGNVVGSNVFNVLAVMGITAIVHPLNAKLEAASGREDAAEAARQIEEAFEGGLAFDFPTTLAFSLFLVALPFLGGKRYGRAKGAFLLAVYVAYSICLFVDKAPVA